MRVGKAESTAGEAIRAASSSDSEESDMMHEEKDFLDPVWSLYIIEEESIENPNPSNLALDLDLSEVKRLRGRAAT